MVHALSQLLVHKLLHGFLGARLVDALNLVGKLQFRAKTSRISFGFRRRSALNSLLNLESRFFDELTLGNCELLLEADVVLLDVLAKSDCI